jgi:hypothetical protein
VTPYERAFSAVKVGLFVATTTLPTRWPGCASAAPRIARRVWSTSICTPLRSGTIVIAPSLVLTNRASAGGLPTVLANRSNQRSAPGPPIASSVAPSRGSASSGAIFTGRRRHHVLPSSRRIGAESAWRTRPRAVREIARLHLRLLDLHRQRGGCAREGREGPDDRRRRGLSVEHAADALRDHERLEPLQDDRRLADGLVELLRELRQLIVERGLVDLRRRRDVGAEHAHADPLEAAERAEAVALLERRVDRRAPVGLDAEPVRRDAPAPVAAEEDDRDVLERLRPPLQQLLGGRRGHPADADTGDRDPCGDA